MHFISEDLENYVAKHSQQEPELLVQLNKETHQKILQPRMLSGHFQGRVLSMLSKIINPKSILEIGTYTGYAALCLAEGLQENGTLDTIDINEELEEIQKKAINYWIDTTEATQFLSGHYCQKKIDWKNFEIKIDLPHSYEKFVIDMDKQWQYGYDKALKAIQK